MYTSPNKNSPARDSLHTTPDRNANAKDRKARRQSARVVGEKVYFPGSPGAVTMGELLEEAEREVGSAVGGAATPSKVGAPASSISAPWTPSISAPFRGMVERRPSSGLAREVVITAAQDADEGRAWTKEDWKALDACFTDERIAVAERLGLVARVDDGGASRMMAGADEVDVGDVVRRFLGVRGLRERDLGRLGEKWDM